MDSVEFALRGAFTLNAAIHSTYPAAAASASQLRGEIDKTPESEKLSALANNNMPPLTKKKKLDYPDETEGSILAAETRRRCNRLTAEERREHLRKAMSIIYGGAPSPKTTGARH